MSNTVQAINPQASLPRLVTEGMRPIYDWDQGTDAQPKGYRLPLGVTTEAIDKALAAIDAWKRPMPKQRIKEGLARLKLLTKNRNMPQDELTATIGLYAENLTKYPAAVVLKVLSSQPDHSQWWPAWAELKERLDAEVFTVELKRLALVQAKHRSPQQSTPRGKRERYSEYPPERKAEVDAVIAKAKAALQP